MSSHCGGISNCHCFKLKTDTLLSSGNQPNIRKIVLLGLLSGGTGIYVLLCIPKRAAVQECSAHDNKQCMFKNII